MTDLTNTTEQPMPFDWKREVTSSLAKNFQSAAVRFDGDRPILVFKPGTSDQVKRQAMIHVTELLMQMADKNLLPIPSHADYAN